MRDWIFGRNPVFEVLRSRRRHLFQLLVARNIQTKGRLEEILHMCYEIGLALRHVDRTRLEQISPNHQGIALEASGYPYSTLEEILDLSRQSNEAPLVLILDTLQDPQNLGTLLRTAEAVGVHGVLLPFRRPIRAIICRSTPTWHERSTCSNRKGYGWWDWKVIPKRTRQTGWI